MGGEGKGWGEVIGIIPLTESLSYPDIFRPESVFGSLKDSRFFIPYSYLFFHLITPLKVSTSTTYQLSAGGAAPYVLSMLMLILVMCNVTLIVYH